MYKKLNKSVEKTNTLYLDSHFFGHLCSESMFCDGCHGAQHSSLPRPGCGRGVWLWIGRDLVICEKRERGREEERERERERESTWFVLDVGKNTIQYHANVKLNSLTQRSATCFAIILKVERLDWENTRINLLFNFLLRKFCTYTFVIKTQTFCHIWYLV